MRAILFEDKALLGGPFLLPMTMYLPIASTPMDGQTVQALCLLLGHSFIPWVGAPAPHYKCQPCLEQQGMGERSHLQLNAQDRTCTNQHRLRSTLGADASCP